MLGAALGVMVVSSCTREPLNNLNGEEGRIYITHHDSTVNFANYSTYSISDSVAVVDNNKLTEKSRSGGDLASINAVKDQMAQRGFKLVDRDQNPDLGLSVSRVYNTYSGVVSYPDYYGYYNGFWDPYYWGYGGYDYYFPTPYYYGTYQVTEGALSVDLLDLKDARSTQKIRGIWNGLVRGTGVFQGNAAVEVQTLFKQSSYLRTSH